MILELELCGLSKSFGSRLVLEGISQSVRAGECLVVTGPNGSGKTTLLKIIAGLLEPTAGELRLAIEGRQLEEDERRDAIGMVAPDLALYDELTSRENLEFFARVRGLPVRHRWLMQLIDLVGLSGRENDPTGLFSSGMKQRLKYAYALLHRPPLLLLDEPTANLDSAGADLVADIVSAQKKMGAVVIATNDRSELKYGEKVIELGR